MLATYNGRKRESGKFNWKDTQENCTHNEFLWLKYQCFKDYPKAPTPYRYLNSGTWIGKASAAKIMLAEVMKKAGNNFKNANDQKLVADMFISNSMGITLDYHNLIFQSMHMTLTKPLPYCNPIEDIISTADGRFYNKRTSGTPAVIHFNGGGKKDHLRMEKMYKDKQDTSAEMKKKLAKYNLNVPTAITLNRRMPFESLCPKYFK